MAASRDNSRKNVDTSVEYMPIATSSTVRIGDILEFDTTNKVVQIMSNATNTANFVGVAGSNYPVTTTEGNVGDFVKVYKTGVFEFDLTTTTVQYHQNSEFRWAGTAGNKVELSTSIPIGRVWKKNIIGDTTVLLRIDKYVAY